MAQRSECSIEGCDQASRARGWCMKHYLRWWHHGDPHHVDYVRGDDEARFWSHVDRPDDPTACWVWTGALTPEGYAQMRTGHEHSGHRFAYRHFVGPIPDGLTLDHACHTADVECSGGTTCAHRRCVNPAHLVPVDLAANTRAGRRAQLRKTHCPQGHPYDEANIYLTAGGHRQCRACNRARARRRASLVA